MLRRCRQEFPPLLLLQASRLPLLLQRHRQLRSLRHSLQKTPLTTCHSESAVSGLGSFRSVCFRFRYCPFPDKALSERIADCTDSWRLIVDGDGIGVGRLPDIKDRLYQDVRMHGLSVCQRVSFRNAQTMCFCGLLPSVILVQPFFFSLY